MKIHNSFDLVFQHVSTTDRDRWPYLHFARITGKKTRDFAKVFVYACSFVFLRKWFLEIFWAPLLRWSSSFSSLFAEALNPAALKQHPSPLSSLPKDDNSQRPRGYNYSLPSFHWIGHLPYGHSTVWKKTQWNKKKVREVIHCFCEGEK